jgi:hypothetical protein
MSSPTPERSDDDDFLKAAGQKERGIVAEFVAFMAENKLWWMTPILIVFLLLGALLAIGATSGGAWIYALF